MKLKNINGTTGNTCACGSWLKHWEKHSGQRTDWCQAKGCAKTDVVGAHVQKSGSSDRNWYIYPLCSAHNKSTEEIEVSDSYKLVSANVSATCG